MKKEKKSNQRKQQKSKQQKTHTRNARGWAWEGSKSDVKFAKNCQNARGNAKKNEKMQN